VCVYIVLSSSNARWPVRSTTQSLLACYDGCGCLVFGRPSVFVVPGTHVVAPSIMCTSEMVF
jgi:hypothetical protein